jgi:hypothetical protein
MRSGHRLFYSLLGFPWFGADYFLGLRLSSQPVGQVVVNGAGMAFYGITHFPEIIDKCLAGDAKVVS